MKWGWELRPAAEREFKKLERKAIKAILEGLDLLAWGMSEHGRSQLADTKKLKGSGSEFRPRVGSFRVRYEVDIRETKNETGASHFVGALVVSHVFNRREGYRSH